MNLFDVPVKDLGDIQDEASSLKDQMENLKKALPEYLKFLVPALHKKRYDDEILNRDMHQFNENWAKDQHRNSVDVMGVLRSLYSSEGPYSTLKR